MPTDSLLQKKLDQHKDFIPQRKMNENELPFVSIIIAARNEEKNIGKCIQSIVSQTYPQKI